MAIKTFSNRSLRDLRTERGMTVGEVQRAVLEQTGFSLPEVSIRSWEKDRTPGVVALLAILEVIGNDKVRGAAKVLKEALVIEG